MKIKVNKCSCQSSRVKDNLNAQFSGSDKHGFHKPHCAKIRRLTIDLDKLTHLVRRDETINLGEIEMTLKALAYALSESR